MSAQPGYPGARLSLPEKGPGSVATFGRRLVAILVDWLLCQLIAYGVWHVEWGATGGESFVPLAIFAVENLVLVSTLGTTVGHRLLGLQVLRLLPVPVDTPAGRTRVVGPPGFRAGLIRTVLLCLVVPALIPDADNRGLHDRAAGTVILRAR
ncbi:MAG TPA: RDD family protein [Ornithinicoccus sp.]|nr:RDD family protein [Ornithinicoccus sp.]